VRRANWREARASRYRDLDFMDQWYPIQVKQKDRVGRPDIEAKRGQVQFAGTARRVLRTN